MASFFDFGSLQAPEVSPAIKLVIYSKSGFYLFLYWPFSQYLWVCYFVTLLHFHRWGAVILYEASVLWLPHYRYGNPILEHPTVNSHYRLSRRSRHSSYRISIQAQRVSGFFVKCYSTYACKFLLLIIQYKHIEHP